MEGLTTQPRVNHLSQCRTDAILSSARLLDEQGTRFDVSDRPLSCSSCQGREIVVGGTDHALYSIDLRDLRRKPITMYTKTSGHTDWVTSVSHLQNGQVLSAAMDGKLCLWSKQNRRNCVNLNRDSMHPISKVLTDERYNSAVSCSYEGIIELWRFSDEDVAMPHAVRPIRGRFGSTAVSSSGADSTIYPTSVLTGHTQPVLDASYFDNILASGDKAGSMMMWDLSTGQALHRFRAHPGAITNIDFVDDDHTVITTGTDGYVKVWDPRTPGSGVVCKVLAHSTTSAPPPRPTASGRYGGGRSTLSSGRGSSTGRGASGSSAPSAMGCPISVMGVFSRRGSSPSAGYIVTGGGTPEDSSLALIDLRREGQVVERWDHHRNGVYSLCLLGDNCVLSGDGLGTVMCHGIDSGESLRYGLGASEQGAVRAIQCSEGRQVITAGEDGKVLVYEFE